MSSNEKYPIGTKVIITRDCRLFKRAVGKMGVIRKIKHYTISKEIFPLEFKKKGQKYRLNINNLEQEEEDLVLNIPIIKYGRFFGRIKGDQCFWKCLNDGKR